MWDKELDYAELYHSSLREAQEEGIIDSARKLLAADFTADIIANTLNLPLERVLQLQSELQANT